MSLQQETDAEVMKVYATATITDLERGAAFCEKLVRTASLIYTYHAKRASWQHHADLLRAEIARRREVMAASELRVLRNDILTGEVDFYDSRDREE